MSALKTLLGGAVRGSSAKSEGLVITDPAVIAEAEKWIAANRVVKEAEGGKEAVELTFKPALRRAWLTGNAGLAKPEGTVRIVTPAGKVTASFAAQWYPKGGDLVALGIPAEYVRTRFSIAIKGDAIPEDRQEALVGELMALMEKHGCAAAITAKVESYPRENFAEDRHRVLTVAQNEALETAGLGTRLALKG